MRQFLTVLLVFFSATLFGQTTNQIDSVTFCFNKYKVPTGCTAQSEYQVQCDNYSIVWLYMNEQMLQSMPDQFVNQMAGQMKKFKKDNGTGYQLIAYGVANGQPVLVQLSFNNELKTNDDIPEFPRQIIRLTK